MGRSILKIGGTMLSNINILAGPPPAKTGHMQTDLDNAIRYANQLVNALELIFDEIDRTYERRVNNEQTAGYAVPIPTAKTDTGTIWRAET